MQREVFQAERRYELMISTGYNVFFYGAARAWCKGATMADLLQKMDLSEGDLVMTFNKTLDLMRQVRDMLYRQNPENPLRDGAARGRRACCGAGWSNWSIRSALCRASSPPMLGRTVQGPPSSRPKRPPCSSKKRSSWMWSGGWRWKGISDEPYDLERVPPPRRQPGDAPFRGGRPRPARRRPARQRFRPAPPRGSPAGWSRPPAGPGTGRPPAGRIAAAMSGPPAAPPTPLALLVQYAQWIVLGTVVAVIWDAYHSPPGAPSPAFYPDQVLRLQISLIFKDTRAAWWRLVEREVVLVLKPYNARHLAVDDRGLFFLTRNAVPAQGGVPYDLAARQTGYIEVGLSQPYRVGGLVPRWISNGLSEPLPPERARAVRAALAAGRAGTV